MESKLVELPATSSTPLVRTDYSDDAGWRKLLAIVEAPNADGFLPVIEVVERPELAGADAAELADNVAKDHALLVIADASAMKGPDFALLCIDTDAGQSLRVIAAELWSIENNLSLANMDFDEFMDAAGDDRIFRGFR